VLCTSKQPVQGASIEGFQLVAWVRPRAAIRARPEWQHIPVIVVTAKDLTEDDRNRLAGSVEKVLEKNACTRDQLLERVSEAIAACNINT
jgi:CheY-like chemotaxis protein